MKTLLFLNGLFPKNIPDISLYDFIVCTDGAYNSLKKKGITPDVISGDLDSIIGELPSDVEIIRTPDQNTTDFEKALDIIKKKEGKKVDVYGASGKEQDHFLGNLTVALKFENKLSITFYDDYHCYFIASKEISFTTQIGKKVSLYPYPSAEDITTVGLKYALLNENLHLRERIGIRNQATKKTVKISFTKGNLVIFIEKD